MVGKIKVPHKCNFEGLLTDFFTMASAATTQEASASAIRVSNWSHFNLPPIQWPLSVAKNHLIHTPRDPTMQASHSQAALPPCLNSTFSNAPATPHNKPNITTYTMVTTKWRRKISTFQLTLEIKVPLPGLMFSQRRNHLKPLAVSTPKVIEEPTRSKPTKFELLANTS